MRKQEINNGQVHIFLTWMTIHLKAIIHYLPKHH